VLRLLVKDVLIGPEKITIRHRIPTRGGSTSTSRHGTEPDTEGDHAPGYPLRWGREDAAPRRASMGVRAVAGLGEDPGLEERLEQRQPTLVLDLPPHPVHQRRVIDRVEARFDAGIQHPPVALAPEMVDLRDRVLSSPPGPAGGAGSWAAVLPRARRDATTQGG
jgi:site-specific DNA recombinase